MSQTEQDPKGRDASVAEPDGCHWTSPELGAAVTIANRVVQQVKSLVLEGYHALPKRGAEVGGLLLGRVVADEPLAIQVDDFEPLPCEYRFGPSFVLSESDRLALEEILSRRRPDAHLAVVGHYRSCTGRELAPDASDEELFRRYFSDPRHVFVAIKPVAARRCVASLFAMREGQIRPAPGAPPFPLGDGPPGLELKPEGNGRGTAANAEAARENAAHPDGHRRHSKNEEAAAGAASLGAAQGPDAAGLPKPRPLLAARSLASGRWREALPARQQRIWPWALAILAVLIGFVYFQYSRETARVARSSHLGLDVRKAPGGILVSWDRSAPAFQNASHGVLSISEASVERRVELGAAEIARGALPYKAAGKDVLVRLSVYGSGPRPTTESFRIVTLAQAAAAPGAAAPAAAIPAARASDAPTPAVVEQPIAVKPDPAPVEPSRQAAPKPPPAEPTKTPVQSRAQSVRAAVPAVAIHQVQPGIPHGVKARIKNTIVVPVQVEIDAAGKVTRVTPSKSGDSLYRYLSGRAAGAARWWRFKPARAPNGKAVPTTKTLYFVFKG